MVMMRSVEEAPETVRSVRGAIPVVVVLERREKLRLRRSRHGV